LDLSPFSRRKPVEAGLKALLSPLAHVLLILAAVILVGRLFAIVLRGFGQPAVIGEVLAGIVLGPSVLGAIVGRWFGDGAAPLVPADVAAHLAIIAELGIVLYMFLVGVEFNTDSFRKLAGSAIGISVASLVTPFGFGVLLGLSLHGDLAPTGISKLSFSLFLGVSLAVTALPVLARILTDRGIARSELGILALSCAAVGDVAAWWLLALVAGVVKSEASGAAVIIGLSVIYIGAMLLVVRPIASRLIGRFDRHALSPTAAAVIFASLLLSALVTDWIGIHAVFGAFLLGVVIPHDSRIAESLKGGLEQVVLVLLLPAFFAYTGMRTQIGLVGSWQQWAVCGVIILVASLGKFGGTLVAARLAGFDWRMSTSLGVLMNTRGLMELIVLNIGLDLGVISPTLFAMLVIMALVTTLATSPLLGILERWAVRSPMRIVAR
jgi:Kef-type K+ transport system membrane component KefB